MVASLNAVGIPTGRERCPVCRPQHHCADELLKSQVVRVGAPRAAPRPVAGIQVPHGYRLARVEGMRFSYVLWRVGTELHTVFSARPDEFLATLEREHALLERGLIDELHEVPGRCRETPRVHRPRKPRRPPNDHPHPATLDSTDPRWQAWRDKIQAGVNRRNDERRQQEGRSA